MHYYTMTPMEAAEHLIIMYDANGTDYTDTLHLTDDEYIQLNDSHRRVTNHDDCPAEFDDNHHQCDVCMDAIHDLACDLRGITIMRVENSY